MMSIRLRVERQRGKTLNIMHLYSLQLRNYEIADIWSFIGKVWSVLVNLTDAELQDKDLLFRWLLSLIHI